MGDELHNLNNLHENLERKHDIVDLIYPVISDTQIIKHVILIHDGVTDSNIFYNNVNHDTFPIIYNTFSSKEKLLSLLREHVTKIERFSLVFHDSGINKLKTFLDGEVLFTYEDIDSTSTTMSNNVQFMVDLIQEFTIQHLDYLACNTLQYEHWQSYYQLLFSKTRVIIGASNDLTGNVKHGGDWILESTNEDIKNLYFTNAIENYQYTLETTKINEDTELTNEKIATYTWPATINAGYTVKIMEDLTISSSTGGTNGYFIIGGDDVTIDGNGKTVTITDITDYPGFLENGTINTIASGTNIIIKDLGVLSTDTTTLVFGEGWIGQQYFGRELTSGTISATNCYSTGNISQYAGGIYGLRTGYYATNTTISATKCYSIGNIEDEAGGIFGYVTGFGATNTIIEATNCYSTGQIGEDTGGIYGKGAGYYATDTTISATNCYSTGNIDIQGGGIFGYVTGFNATNTTIEATNCYSIGNISQYAGGIFGSDAGYNATDTTIDATNCYSIGNIEYRAGGIFGFAAGSSASNTTISATNCYSIGQIGIEAGGIFGLSTGYYATNTIILATNCYSIGNIGNLGGGIFGRYTGLNATGTTTIDATNCYSVGSVTTTGNGIYGSNKVIGITDRCYIANTTWDDSIATTSLTDTANVWLDYDTSATNVPWLLQSYNAEVYNPNNQTLTVPSGTSGQGIFQPNYNYLITNNPDSSKISINASNGQLTFTDMVYGNSYIIPVFTGIPTLINSINTYYGYNLNSYNLSARSPLYMKGATSRRSRR